jgi:hypothetical protein
VVESTEEEIELPELEDGACAVEGDADAADDDMEKIKERRSENAKVYERGASEANRRTRNTQLHH